MGSNTQNCGICNEILHSHENTRIVEVVELLKFLIIKIHYKHQDSLICESCLTRIQSAYKFKIRYLRNSQNNIDILMKEEYSTNYTCEICKYMIDRNENISLFDSVTNLRLMSYLSPELVSKTSVNPQICKQCYKSFLNFYTITNLLSFFDQGFIVDYSKNEFDDKNDNKDFQLTVDIFNSVNTEGSKLAFKKEDANSTSIVLKKEVEDNTLYENFQIKNEDFQIKDEENYTVMDDDKNSEEEIWQHKVQSEINNTNLLQHGGNRIEESQINYIINAVDNNIKDSLSQHMVLHKDVNAIEIFQCKFCEIQIQHKLDFIYHMRAHENLTEIDTFQCQNCEFQTKYKGCLKRHMVIHKDANEIEMFQCETCDYQTKHKPDIKRHMLIHKDANETEMFQCETCDYQTKHKRDLKRHMLIHKDTNEIEMFQCEICEIKIKRKRDIKEHMLIHKSSNEIEIFRCGTCDYQTKRNRDLKRHIMRVHNNLSEISKFQCQICEFRTKYKGCLKRHMVIHKDVNEIEMFQCDICDYQTKHKRDVKNHIVIHKSFNEIEIFQCGICKYQTKRNGDLKRHIMRVHNN